MYHFRKTHKNYRRHRKADEHKGDCPFCDTLDERIVKSTKTMNVIPNRVFYDIFEGRKVLDHLMIVPKRHIETLKDFTDKEKVEMMTLAGEYESQGYNVYARGVGSLTRSVKHQHTHLIKITNERMPRMYVYIRKPYLLIHK